METDFLEVHLGTGIVHDDVEVNGFTRRSGILVHVRGHGDATLVDAAQEGNVRLLERLRTAECLLQRLLDDDLLLMSQITGEEAGDDDFGSHLVNDLSLGLSVLQVEGAGKASVEDKLKGKDKVTKAQGALGRVQAKVAGVELVRLGGAFLAEAGDHLLGVEVVLLVGLLVGDVRHFVPVHTQEDGVQMERLNHGQAHRSSNAVAGIVRRLIRVDDYQVAASKEFK